MTIIHTPSKQSHRSQDCGGFSLIEILVVLLIIGITVTFALVSFGDFGKRRQIITDAEQFIEYVKLVEQQAILENNSFCIQWRGHTYQVLRFQSSGRWESMLHTGFFHIKHVSQDIRIRLDVSEQHSKDMSIVVFSTGQITPFTLHFDTPSQVDIAVIKGTADGTLTLIQGAS